LTVAVREQASHGDGVMAADTRLTSAALVWLSELERSDLAANTRQLYQAAARLYVVPTLGALRIGDLSVPIIEHALTSIGSRHGPHPARAARRALSSLCHCAGRHGALRVNPVRDTRPIACPRKRVRALTTPEAADLQARLRADPTAGRVDLPDFVEFMLGTGVRIEACAIREAVLDVTAGTVHINATVVRVNGAKLQIQPRTKTAGSERILHLPPHLVRMLKRRRLAGHLPGPAGVIFTSPAGASPRPVQHPGRSPPGPRPGRIPLGQQPRLPQDRRSRLDDEGYGIRHIADQLGQRHRFRRCARTAHWRGRVSGSFLVRF
jgi:integrase